MESWEIYNIVLVCFYAVLLFLCCLNLHYYVNERAEAENQQNEQQNRRRNRRNNARFSTELELLTIQNRSDSASNYIVNRDEDNIERGNQDEEQNQEN